jgi:phage baseplate assembly protein W
MRRHIGSNIPRMVDMPISPVTLIDVYAAVAEALRLEPRFKVVRMGVQGVSDGRLTIDIKGIYYPRGHLGDFSVQEPKTASVSV